MADETVSGEPVSGSKFPASRENAGNFCEFEPDQANGVWLKCWYCVVFLQNSLRNPAGNFRAEFDPEQGIRTLPPSLAAAVTAGVS